MFLTVSLNKIMADRIFLPLSAYLYFFIIYLSLCFEGHLSEISIPNAFTIVGTESGR